MADEKEDKKAKRQAAKEAKRARKKEKKEEGGTGSTVAVFQTRDFKPSGRAVLEYTRAVSSACMCTGTGSQGLIRRFKSDE